MATNEERTYTAAEAARLIGCSAATFAHRARRVLGIRRRPGKQFAFTAAQIEAVRADLDAWREQRERRER